jgi:hypothetical protein
MEVQVTDTIERETTVREAAPEITAPHRPLVRWVELLVFMMVAAIAAVGLWMLNQPEPASHPFDLNEQMRFERMREEAALREFVTAEDLAATVTHPFDLNEQMRFERMREEAAAAALQRFGAAEDALRVPYTHPFDLNEQMRFERLRAGERF